MTHTTNEKLSERRCEACYPGTPALKGDKLKEFLNRIHSDWQISDEHHIEREFRFKNFRKALDFTAQIGEMSEEQGHHPEIWLTWGKVRLKVYTHAIDGLSESDFIWAAKADEVVEKV